MELISPTLSFSIAEMGTIEPIFRVALNIKWLGLLRVQPSTWHLVFVLDVNY